MEPLKPILAALLQERRGLQARHTQAGDVPGGIVAVDDPSGPARDARRTPPGVVCQLHLRMQLVPIDPPQVRQRPRSATQLATGTFSNHESVLSHRVQWEPGHITDSRRGSR